MRARAGVPTRCQGILGHTRFRPTRVGNLPKATPDGLALRAHTHAADAVPVQKTRIDDGTGADFHGWTGVPTARGRDRAATVSNQIGGGAEDCETCPDGYEPNAARTACVSPYRVARCSRPLGPLPAWLGEHLPIHVNAVSEAPGDRMERGFFAVDMAGAVANATIYVVTSGVVIFTEGVIEQDADLGTCVYESNMS